MSPYSQTLAAARLDALEALVQALKDAETPDEKRRCAVAIFNAPEPCKLDDTIEYTDDEEDDHAPRAQPAPVRATGSPAALSGQPVPGCNAVSPSPAAHTPSLLASLPRNPLDLLNTLHLPPPRSTPRPHTLLTRAGAPL